MLLPISNAPEFWNENDLKQLCNDRIPENQRLDYKRVLVLDPPRERRELLKDVTALANSLGGVIIYGVGEDTHADLGKIPSGLYPMNDSELIDKANRIIRTSISPGMEYHIYKIPASGEGFYIVIYVPQSINRPHAIVWERRMDWFIRKNQDIFSLTEPELREMYLLSSQFRQAFDKRYGDLDLDIGTAAGWSIVSMPFTVDSNMLDTLSITGEKLLKNSYIRMFGGSNLLQPMVDRFEEIKCNTRGDIIATRLFRNGEFMVSSGFTDLTRENGIPSASVYRCWFWALKYFGEIYSDIGYYGPLRIWLETKELDNENIKVHAKFDYNVDLKFGRKKVLIWIESKVEAIANPVDICNSLFRYFIQGCGTDISTTRLKELESYARSS